MWKLLALVHVLISLAPDAIAQPGSSGGQELADRPLEELLNMEVRTASLRKQTLQDAPASVTVVTADDIRRHGYRTLADVLSSVRSFYVTGDGAFQFAGVRGFSLLGDYNTRFLVMINGHQLTDNVYASMYYFGEDFPLSMDLVDRIEIVRGPSSALYGSNGLFATINVLTRTPANASPAHARLEMGSMGEYAAGVDAAFPIGGGARALISVSGSLASGREVVFPDLAAARVSPDRAAGVDRGNGARAYANVLWKDWSFTALIGGRRAVAPGGWYGTVVGSSATTDTEFRNYVEASWERPAGHSGSIQWRAYYDQFRYDGVYDCSNAGYSNFDGATGDWVGSQFIYRREDLGGGSFTLGADANVDLRNLQYSNSYRIPGSDAEMPPDFRKVHRGAGGGLFTQKQWSLSPSITAYAGVRLDRGSRDSAFLSPRAALIYSRRATAYKFMYGRGFRNPSTYERYWEPSPGLKAEQVNTLEFAREQALGSRAALVTSVFTYRLNGLIEGIPVTADVLQYRNSSRVSANGVEAEWSGRPVEWLETVFSFSLQRTRGASGTRLQNSPGRLGRIRFSAPLFGKRLHLAGAVRYIGARLDAWGGTAPGAALADATLTAPFIRRAFDLQFGVRNLLNTYWEEPLSPEHIPQRLPGVGRTAFVRMTWRYD